MLNINCVFKGIYGLQLPSPYSSLGSTMLKRKPGKGCGKAGHFDIIKGVGHSEEQRNKTGNESAQNSSFISVI